MKNAISIQVWDEDHQDWRHRTFDIDKILHIQPDANEQAEIHYESCLAQVNTLGLTSVPAKEVFVTPCTYDTLIAALRREGCLNLTTLHHLDHDSTK